MLRASLLVYSVHHHNRAMRSLRDLDNPCRDVIAVRFARDRNEADVSSHVVKDVERRLGRFAHRDDLLDFSVCRISSARSRLTH